MLDYFINLMSSPIYHYQSLKTIAQQIHIKNKIKVINFINYFILITINQKNFQFFLNLNFIISN